MSIRERRIIATVFEDDQQLPDGRTVPPGVNLFIVERDGKPNRYIIGTSKPLKDNDEEWL